MAEQLPNINSAISGWANVTDERFKEALKSTGVKEYSRQLVLSIRHELIKHNGNIDEVLLKFAAHGRFVDMRVGRGAPMGSAPRSRLKAYGRAKKMWYSKTKTREIAILREMLVTQYQVQTVRTIEDGLTFTQNLTLS
jgi:hypothetical protein